MEQPNNLEELIHCPGDCEHLCVSNENNYEAECKLLNRDLFFHDFFLVECCDYREPKVE